MGQDIASAINTAFFHLQALAHIWSMYARRNAKGAITAITHQNATAAIALRYYDIIITTVRTAAKGVTDVKENESSQRLKIHTASLPRNMRQGMNHLRMIRA
jgi:hypothetical protein